MHRQERFFWRKEMMPSPLPRSPMASIKDIWGMQAKRTLNVSDSFRLTLFQVAAAMVVMSDDETHGLDEGKKIFILFHSWVWNLSFFLRVIDFAHLAPSSEGIAILWGKYHKDCFHLLPSQNRWRIVHSRSPIAMLIKLALPTHGIDRNQQPCLYGATLDS